jgi:hypothetical protein
MLRLLISKGHNDLIMGQKVRVTQVFAIVLSLLNLGLTLLPLMVLYEYAEIIVSHDTWRFVFKSVVFDVFFITIGLISLAISLRSVIMYFRHKELSFTFPLIFFCFYFITFFLPLIFLIDY